MREQRIYGTALILSAVGMLATASFHPTGSQLLASQEAVAHFGLVNRAVHGLAPGSVWLSFFGIVGLSRALGLHRPDVTAALTAFATGAMAVSCAAVMDGLVASELAKGVFAADETARNGALQLMRYTYVIASSMTRFYMVAASAAILLWSVAMIHTRFNRALPWVGFAIALLGFVGQFSGLLRMNTHDLMLMVLGQGVWTVWTGVVLIRRPPN